MDEEELEQPSSKINVGSFFERVDSVDRVANRALSQSTSNLGIVNNQQLIIQSLSVSIEAMETKIRDIANYIIIERKIEKDAEEDRRLEKEDREQKNKMLERAMGLKGEPGPQGEQGVKGEDRDPGGGGFLGGLIKTIAAIGIGGFALKYIGPVLLPKLLLLAKTKLIPIIGTALKGAFTKLASLLGATLKGLVAKIPVVGKALAGGGLIGGISAGIAKIGSFISNALSGKGGGQTSDSNLNVSTSPVNEMTDTLTDNNLVENEGTKSYESFSEYRNRGNIEGGVDEGENVSGEGQDGVPEGSVRMVTYTRKTKSGTGRSSTQAKVVKGGRLDSLTKGEIVDLYAELHKRYNGQGEKLSRQEETDYKHRVPGLMWAKYGVHSGSIESVLSGGDTLDPFVRDRLKPENLEPVSDNKGVDLSLKGLDERVNNVANVVTDQGNKNQNQGVVTPLNTSQTANASIENTTSDVNFVRFNKNQFIASQHRNLPPEVLRRLT